MQRLARTAVQPSSRLIRQRTGIWCAVDRATPTARAIATGPNRLRHRGCTTGAAVRSGHREIPALPIVDTLLTVSFIAGAAGQI